jgi:hypothetical protein
MPDDPADFQTEAALMMVYKSALTDSPEQFVKVCQGVGIDPEAAASGFDPTTIDDVDARVHVIRLKEYMAKPGWKRTLGIN